MTTTETTAHEALLRLQKLGRRRTRLMTQLADVEHELMTDAIPAAHRAGASKLGIARAAGVVRQTVYNVLAREETGR